MVTSSKRIEKSPIAIIGMSCQFPGAIDVPSYWELIKANRCVIGAPPAIVWLKVIICKKWDAL